MKAVKTMPSPKKEQRKHFDEITHPVILILANNGLWGQSHREWDEDYTFWAPVFWVWQVNAEEGHLWEVCF